MTGVSTLVNFAKSKRQIFACDGADPDRPQDVIVTGLTQGATANAATKGFGVYSEALTRTEYTG